MIWNITTDIPCASKKCTWFLIGLIPCPMKGSRMTDKAWYSVVGTVLSPLQNLGRTGAGLKWNCADGFQRQWYPLFVAWFGDYPEHVLIAQVSYASCPMYEFLNSVLMGNRLFDHSTTEEIRMFTQIFLTKPTLKLCTLLVFILTEARFGNTHSAMSIGLAAWCISSAALWFS